MFSFRPAVRENVGLLIGLAGASGSGKTYTAMRLASGIGGGKPFAVIDTEAGRAKHYADQFKFDHGDLAPPFSPDRYAEAIMAADEAGYPVIVVDSVSHEWAGDGGVLDMQIAEFDRLGNREAVKLLSWSKPKQAHKHMIQKLLQVRAHLILCFRAEEKVDMIKGDDGKMKIVPKVSSTGIDGWMPVCEKSLPYELTASFLLMASSPGIPKPIKLQAQHKPLFPLDKPITEESGRLIAEWAAGGTKAGVAETVDAPSNRASTARSLSEQDGVDNRQNADGTPIAGSNPASRTINANQAADLDVMLTDAGIPRGKLLEKMCVAKMSDITEAQFQRAIDWIARVVEARKERT